MYTYPDRLRSVEPAAWPQVPYDEPPTTPERSRPEYSIVTDIGVRVPLRDGVDLVVDVFRPYAPRGRFPALISASPYTRILQSTSVQLGENEAGITQFWVPRGYVHIILDVRGTGDSEGQYDLLGTVEQQDLYDAIEWAAAQPWCDGNVGMTGCSYFAMTQVLVAPHAPPSLKAIFPYDAATDTYREFYCRGGAPQGLWFQWMSDIVALNCRGARTPDPAGIYRHMEGHLRLEHPLDGPYWRERSAEPRLGEITIPTYFGCDWTFQSLHLRGAFEGWERTGAIPKRLLIGPSAKPFRIFGAYHVEALRWYDHWLKGMDTGVTDGEPIRLYIPGLDSWRGEREWPLARTDWQELFLGGPEGGLEGTLRPTAGPATQRSFTYDPHSVEMISGRPCLTYRSKPLSGDLEVTGPIALYLHAAGTARDIDLYARFYDEVAGGDARLVCRGALRASHRELDVERSRPWLPYHPHLREDPPPPNQDHEYAIELWPTSNLFRRGHRLRLEISSSDSIFLGIHSLISRLPNVLLPGSTNTVLEGAVHPSRLVLPVIPASTQDG